MIDYTTNNFFLLHNALPSFRTGLCDIFNLFSRLVAIPVLYSQRLYTSPSFLIFSLYPCITRPLDLNPFHNDHCPLLLAVQADFLSKYNVTSSLLFHYPYSWENLPELFLLQTEPFHPPSDTLPFPTLFPFSNSFQSFQHYTSNQFNSYSTNLMISPSK